YAIRFIKSFSGAKIFGWTEAAPGEKVGSELSFLYHTANTARRLMEDAKMPTQGLMDPRSESLDSASAKVYLNTLMTILGGNEKADLAVAAWIEHGRASKPAQKHWGFD